MRPSLISALRRDSAQMLPSERHTRLYFSAVLLVVGVLTLARAAALR